MSKAYPVKFSPIPQERIWGGNQLKSWFGASALEAPIGEYWVLSGHPNGTSVVTNGELSGKSLVDIIEMNPDAYLGNSPQPRFPLLIKFLEATTDLSVQIHPDDAYAQAHEGDFGKTEAWYVLSCDEAGRVNYGHRFGSQSEYFDAIKESRVKEYLGYQQIQKEQVVFVPARTLHALLSGTIVVEVQQTSDVTYRLYDWDRVDKNGQPRELHIEKAAAVMQYGEARRNAIVEPVLLEQTPGVKHERLLTCDYFTLEKLQLNPGVKALTKGTVQNPDILIVVDGQTELMWEDGSLVLDRGDTVLIPATLAEYQLVPKTEVTVLRTFY